MSYIPYIPVRQTVVNGAGRPYAAARRWFYLAGTLTEATAYAYSTGTQLTQPQRASSAGRFDPVYMDPSNLYRVIVQDANGNTITDDDNIPSSYVTTASVGLALYPQTQAEIDASITPTNYSYPTGNVRRYGAVGNGSTADDDAFVDALASVASISGTVHVPATVNGYVITTALVVPSGVTITGEGLGSIVRQTTANTACFTLSSVNNVTFKGLHIKGNVGDVTTGSVSLNAATKVTITGCWFTGMSGWGVHSIGASADVRVTDCTFRDWVSPINGSAAINVYNEGERFTFTGNTISGGSTSSSTGAYFGIGVLRASGTGTFKQFVISNNQITGLREYGIVLYGNTDTTTDVTVTGNTIDYVYGDVTNTSSGAGIYLLRPGNTTITGNTIGHTNIATAASTLAPGAIGINAAYGNLVITGNTIHDTTMYGIYAVAGAATSSIAIKGNGIYAPGYSGIHAYQQNDVTISGNTITTTAATANIAAISVLGLVGTHLENVTVTGNEILAAGDQQVQFVYADDVIFSSNNVEMTDTSGSAVVFSACDRAVINGNVIKSDATSGVALYLSAVTAGRVSGNYLLCNHANAYYETTGTCTGTFADESNGLSLATNAGTGSNTVLRVAAVPSAGTAIAGDRAWDTDTAAAATPGWVCTTGGSPGTWKAMASVAA